MIQLVVLCDSLPAKTYSFDKQNIVIGREGSSHVDIPIPDDSLADSHLTITVIENKMSYTYSVINSTNDPFCTFNDVPFGRRRLQVGDVITLGTTTIRCEQILITQAPPPARSRTEAEKATAPLQTPPAQPETLSSPPEEQVPNQATKEFAAKEEAPQEEGTQPQAVPSSNDALAPPPMEPETITTIPQKAAKAHSTNHLHDGHEHLPQVFLKGPKLSIKDDYLREYDDDSETNPFRKRERGLNDYNAFIHAPKSWSMVGKFLAASLAALSIIMGLLYINVRDQTAIEEINAAKGVADVSMALAYAQVRDIKPQSHNWSEPEFVQNNLMAVLAPDHIPLADFDTHGQFTGCPYMLRIYTGSDLTHFIVIAQPAPSVLQWLVPKASIVLNSSSMEIRKIFDLKTINRLLVNSSTLDAKDDKELVALINKGELIPLSDLVNKSEHQGFSPPKTLSMIHPGAENYVYNAPRYYPLGENFIDQMISIFDTPSSNHDIFMVRQELSALNRFPHLLLYTSKGIEHARQAQKALTTLSPNGKFLLGYTQVNSKGKIAGTHILLDEFADTTPESGPAEEIAYNEVQRKKGFTAAEGDAIPKDQVGHPEASAQGELASNLSDPFLLQLHALVTSRTQALKPLCDEIDALLTAHTQNWAPDFFSQYEKALARYAKVDEEQKEKITKSIGAFVQEHRHLPASRFLEYVATAKATSYFQGYLESVRGQSAPVEEIKRDLDARFQEITTSMSWTTLEANVAKAAALLNFETIPDITLLVRYQNELSSKVIQKLNQLLLSSDQSLSPDSFTSETHETLTRILEISWIDDPETQRFYLSEFDMHLR